MPVILLLLSALAARADTVYDATQTLVIANPEVTSMAGAGTSFVYGASGLLLNPAALAYRPYGRGAGTSVTLKLAQHHLRDAPTDLAPSLFALSNDGTLTEGGVGAATDLGAGGVVGSRLSGSDGLGTTLTVDEWHLALARGFANGHVLVGAGSRLLAVRLDEGGITPRLQGGGLEAGLILARIGHGLNVGVTARTPVRAVARTVAPEPTPDAPMAPPAGAVAPWQVVVGASWDSAASHCRSRIPALRVAADVVTDGAVEDGVAMPAGVESPLQASGIAYTVSPRLGGELELLPDRLRLRAGSYLEPSRTTLMEARLHGTGGLELRLFRLKALSGLVDLDVSWRVAADLAKGYTHVSWAGIGAWQRPRVVE